MEVKNSESLYLAPEVDEMKAYGGTQKQKCDADKPWSEGQKISQEIKIKGHKPSY